MGNKFSHRLGPKRQSRALPDVSRCSPMMKKYGVFIVLFIQMTHDHALAKNRKCWGSFVVIDLRFPNSEPGKLVAVTAKNPANTKSHKEMLKRLQSVDRSTCDDLNWAILWNFIENRSNDVEEFNKFKLELETCVNRGRLSVDHVIAKARPSVYWPSKDSEMRLLRFQLQFHEFQ